VGQRAGLGIFEEEANILLLPGIKALIIQPIIQLHHSICDILAPMCLIKHSASLKMMNLFFI
jgi:hypothetical protein